MSCASSVYPHTSRTLQAAPTWAVEEAKIALLFEWLFLFQIFLISVFTRWTQAITSVDFENRSIRSKTDRQQKHLTASSLRTRKSTGMEKRHKNVPYEAETVTSWLKRLTIWHCANRFILAFTVIVRDWDNNSSTGHQAATQLRGSCWSRYFSNPHRSF